MKKRTTMIQGPVGIFGANVELNAPPTAPITPNTTEIAISGKMRKVSIRAPATGMISKADINTTPTAWIPIAIAKMDAVEINISFHRIEKPRTFRYSALNAKK